MNPEERRRFAKLNTAWLAGEKIEGLKFLHNSTVEVSLQDGTTKTGWVVGATVSGPEPMYTIEADDGSGDIERPESAIKNVQK